MEPNKEKLIKEYKEQTKSDLQNIKLLEHFLELFIENEMDDYVLLISQKIASLDSSINLSEFLLGYIVGFIKRQKYSHSINILNKYRENRLMSDDILCIYLWYCYIMEKENDNAMGEIKRAMQIRTLDPMPFYAMGITYLEQSKYDKAREVFQTTTDLCIKLEKLMDIDKTTGKVVKIRIKKYIKPFRQYAEICKNWTKALLELSKGNYESAEELFKRANKSIRENKIKAFYQDLVLSEVPKLDKMIKNLGGCRDFSELREMNFKIWHRVNKIFKKYNERITESTISGGKIARDLIVCKFVYSLFLMGCLDPELEQNVRNGLSKRNNFKEPFGNYVAFFCSVGPATKILRDLTESKAQQFLDSLNTFAIEVKQYPSPEDVPIEKQRLLIKSLVPFFGAIDGQLTESATAQIVLSRLDEIKTSIFDTQKMINEGVKRKTSSEMLKYEGGKRLEYEEKIDLNNTTLEIDYISEEPIVKINNRVVEEFKVKEVFFARFVRLTVARKVNELGRNGRIYKYDEPDETEKSKKFNLYIGGFRQKNEEKRQVQKRSRKRDKELYDLRKFLEKDCRIYGLNEDAKKKLIVSRKGSNEVNLGILQENITVNAGNLKKFKSNLCSVQADKYGIPPSEITEQLIKDAIEAYKSPPHNSLKSSNLAHQKV